MKLANTLLFLTIYLLSSIQIGYASDESLKNVIRLAELTENGNFLSNQIARADCPTLSVAVTNPVNCGDSGELNFTFTNVPNGTYVIKFNGGNFSNVLVTNNKAKVNAAPRTYKNLTITVSGCTSSAGVDATILEGALPPSPTVNVENRCGKSVLTASNFTGSLLWSTGETADSIIVSEAGDYTVTQTVNGCVSDVATATATPLLVPVLSVSGNDPLLCSGTGSLDFTFTNIINGVYDISYDEGTLKNVVIIDNKSTVSTPTGTYTNLIITANNTCASDEGVSVTLSDPIAPDPPDVTVEDSCGESVLTASNYIGTLLWSTGESTESITVSEPGDYTVTQTVLGCTSDAAIATADPLIIPTLLVLAQDPEHCITFGKLNFTFTDVPDGTYTISYDGGSFSDVAVEGNSAAVQAESGTYNNLQITVNDCSSELGVNAIINDSDMPNAPSIAAEDFCGESVLTASDYSGSLLWSTGETSESITVTEDGDYSVSQNVDGCVSDTALITITIATAPTLTVVENNPLECLGNGSLDFTFTGVPDGTYNILYADGQFDNVSVLENSASVDAPAGTYENLTIEVNGCLSADGVNAMLIDPDAPSVPEVLVEDGCGETVLTATNYTGTLYWSTGETSESIIVNESGEYTLTQTIGGCTSDFATAFASPQDIPTLSVVANNPEGCLETGSLAFTFTNVPDGTYTINYDGGSFTGVIVNNNQATVSANVGSYNNINITANGCTSINEVNVEISNSISIGKLGFDSVFPFESSNIHIRAIPVLFSESATIYEISIYHNGGNGNLLMGVYSDNSGSPGSLLGISVPTEVNSAEGWQKVSLLSPVNVNHGEYVWLAWVFENYIQVRYGSTETPFMAQSSSTILDGFPSSFGAFTRHYGRYSIYCTYSTYTPPPTPKITAENQCGQTILTASEYSGALLWSTGETTESIIVEDEGTYIVTQTINGCVSEEASIEAVPNPVPTLSVAKTDPEICNGNGFLNFTFTDVPDGIYTIQHDQGEFNNVTVSGKKATVEAPAGSYYNLTISVDGCNSLSGVNAVLSAPDAPSAPVITAENNCGESILTASDYTGTLLWNTGETTESIVVTEPGDYLVTQTVNGCISDAAIINAQPKANPALLVSVNNPENCQGEGSLEFTFTRVPDGNYTIYFIGGSFASVSVINNIAIVKARPGTYNNLTITVNGCTSDNGVNAVVNSTEPPPPPNVTVENLCGESVLTATDYSGELLWNNGKTTESITVTDAGEYWVSQTIDGCMSDAAYITAAPYNIPSLSVTAENPVNCNESGTLNFEFTNVPDGAYSISYTGGNFENVNITNNKASVNAFAGTYSNLRISVGECTSETGIRAVISDPNPPETPLVIVEDNCGESVLTASGYTGSLKWNTGETTSSIIVKEAGEYTVAQTVDGCTSDGASILASPKVIPDAPDLLVENNCDNTSILTATNYEKSAALKWSTGESTETITVNNAGIYNLKQVLDGCESEAVSKSVQPKSPPIMEASVINPENCGEQGTINFNFTNVPDGLFTIYYDGGSFDNVQVTDNKASVQVENGTYINLTVSVNDCSSAGEVNVEVAAPNSIAAPTVVVEDKCGESVLTVTESNENALLLWSTGETTKSITVDIEGIYSVSQSLEGCKSTDAIVTASPIATPDIPDIEIQGDCSEAIVLIQNMENDSKVYWEHNNIKDSTINNTISLTETGAYRFYQKLGECTSGDTTIIINSFAAPEAPISLGDKMVCETDPMPLLLAEADPPAGNYEVVWYQQAEGGTQVNSPSLNQIGKVTYYAESKSLTGNCGSSVRTAVTLTIKPSPVSAITDDIIVGKPNNNVAVLIFPKDSMKYQWFLNSNAINGAESQYYYISSSERNKDNVFSVKVEMDNGCSSIFAYAYPSNLSSGEITGIADMKSSEIPGSFIVYPNPASSKVFVALNDFKFDENQTFNVKIYSVNGACVLTSPVDVLPKSIDIDKFRPGIYSVVLYRDQELIGTKNLIIRK